MVSSFSCAQFSETFSDGEYLNNPQWIGDYQYFGVKNNRLVSKASGASMAYLSTECHVNSEATWEFFCQINGPTSSYNYCIIYLMSNTADPTQADGVYVKIGGSSKNIVLLQKKGNQTITLVENHLRQNILAADMNKLWVRASLEEDGKITLYTKVQATIIDTEWVLEGTYNMEERLTSNYFSIWMKNSASRGFDFSFGDFVVEGDIKPEGLIAPNYDKLDSISVRLQQESFSPNGDGWNDVCSILYQLPTEGYCATIAIYTPRGYQIRSLTTNLLLDKEGSIWWDGKMDNGSLAQVGVYVVVFEAINNHLSHIVRCKMAVAISAR